MQTTEGMRLFLSHTATRFAAKQGWSAEEIMETFNNPKAIYENKQREGQYRIAGTKIVIIGFPRNEGAEFFGVTMIVNGSAAPVKEEK